MSQPFFTLPGRLAWPSVCTLAVISQVLSVAVPGIGHCASIAAPAKIAPEPPAALRATIKPPWVEVVLSHTVLPAGPAGPTTIVSRLAFGRLAARKGGWALRQGPRHRAFVHHRHSG